MKLSVSIKTIFFCVGIMFCFLADKSAISLEYDELPKLPDTAKAPSDPLFDKEALKAIDYTFMDEYEKALAILDTVTQKYPDHPAPYFLKSAIYQNWMGSFRFNHFQDSLEYCINQVIEKSYRALEKHNDPWIYFYLGSAYGFRGYNRFTKHNWIGAYFDGIKGINHFETAIELDSTLYDVFLGLGSYHYWRTAKSKFINTVAFWIPDKRELGLKQLEFSMQHGRYCPDQATSVLIATLIDYKKYKRAQSVLENSMIKRVKPNISDLYLQGYLKVKFQKWPEVENIFKLILQRLENHKYQSYGYQAECKYWIAKSLAMQNQTEKALQIATEAMALDQKRNKNDEVEGPADSYEDIKEQLIILIKNLNSNPDF